MITISPDGVPIAYSVIGDGPPLVLLHGFTETAASWQEAGYVDRFLRAGRQVVLIDCRGHGQSGKPREAASYTGERRAQDVIAVLDAIEVERRVLEVLIVEQAAHAFDKQRLRRGGMPVLDARK